MMTDSPVFEQQLAINASWESIGELTASAPAERPDGVRH